MSGTYDDSVGVEVSSDSFWEVGNYKRTVKRIDDGHRLCNDLMNCIHERARIEKVYAQQLTEWAKRWKQLVERGPQYGTVEKAWHNLMTEAEKVSELHLEVKNALMNEDFEKIKNWQKEAFHKQMMGGFKETKEADDGFRKAQKPWAKKLKEVEAAKKSYHAACKEEKLATSRETNSKADPAMNPEQLKKLQDKVEKSKQDSQKTKEKYEKSLKDLDGTTPQYMENMEQVFEQCQQLSELHLEVKNALMNEDFEKIKNWQKEAFHKQMIGGFKETKEAEDGFRKAQKPWAKKLKEVEAAKKTYHTACKEEKLATSREANSKADPAMNPEQLKKLQDKVEKSKQDSQKTKEKYEKALKDLDGTTPQYMENMEQVFEQCQQFEDKRLSFFREVLLEVEKHLDLSNVDSYANIYRELEYSIKSADAVEDLKWFRNNHGPGMSMNWPQFEEWSADLNRTLSRREKKKPTDGVTLTGISQSGEQSSIQNKHSSHLSVQSVQSSNNPFEDEEETGSINETENKKIENVSSYEKTYPTEWSDDESNNPFTANDSNGDSNPFEEDAPAGTTEVRVRALYDYEGQELDELSFKAGEELTKIEDEDEQGWCKGRLDGGQVGLYPANYVEGAQ